MSGIVFLVGSFLKKKITFNLSHFLLADKFSAEKFADSLMGVLLSVMSHFYFATLKIILYSLPGNFNIKVWFLF